MTKIQWRSAYFSIALSFLFTSLWSQEASNYATNIFRGTRITNGHSTKMLYEGELEMIIGHRFGRLNAGGYELFGLDQANIRLGLDYAPRNWIMLGAGRSSLGKEFDAYTKVRLLRQSASNTKGWPLSATYLGTIAYNTLRASDPDRPLAWQNRLAFTHQLLLARKVNDRLSLQTMPTVAHYNLVDSINTSNDKLLLGLGGKYQLTKNLALTAEYYYSITSPQEGITNPLSIGIDLNTGSHVFQLHFTNAAGMIEKQFLGETTGNWLDGDIHFGFNIVRTFKLKGRRY